MNKHFIVITAVMVIGLFGLSATANGQETFETVIPDFVVTCTSTGQLCDPLFSVSGELGSVLQAQYFVRSTHCSSSRVHLFVDGTLKLTTGFLGWPGAPFPFAQLPLDTGLVDLGPVSPGAHLISVQAEGQVSGCNVGKPFTWGGSLKVLTNVPTSPLAITVPPPVLCNGLPATIVGTVTATRSSAPRAMMSSMAWPETTRSPGSTATTSFAVVRVVISCPVIAATTSCSETRETMS